MAEVGILKSIPYLLSAPSKQIWTDYDEATDVLYISFRQPQQANDSILEKNAIYHYRDEELVGITVLNASMEFKESDLELNNPEDFLEG